MSVLIMGMEMPTSCRACLYSRTDIRNVDWCLLTEKDLPCDCPIIPVPPHGDLIERDVAYDKIAEQEGGNYVDMDAVGMGLNETPVIIPAEEATQKDEGQDEAPAGPYDLLYEEGGYNSNGV